MSVPSKSMFVQTIRSTGFLLPILLLLCSFLVLTLYYEIQPDLSVFPNREFEYHTYTDRANEGNSTILGFQVNDSLIQVDFKLNDQFQSPYIGITLAPKSQQPIDASYYNELLFRVQGEGIDKLGLSIFTPLMSEPEAPFHTFLSISEKTTSYHLPIDDFLLPDWWKELHSIPMKENPRPALDQTLHLNIGTAYTPNIVQPMTLKIHSIQLTRDNAPLYTKLALIYPISCLLLFLVIFLTKAYHAKNTSITVQYQALQLDKKQPIESFIDYINTHFQDSQLSIESVAKETGISPRKITQTIKEQFNCNFKSYINHIRIKESQRLLSSTRLNIGEVAYKVGFNNQSHFNRVFKNEVGQSPSEYRDCT